MSSRSSGHAIDRVWQTSDPVHTCSICGDISWGWGKKWQCTRAEISDIGSVSWFERRRAQAVQECQTVIQEPTLGVWQLEVSRRPILGERLGLPRGDPN